MTAKTSFRIVYALVTPFQNGSSTRRPSGTWSIADREGTNGLVPVGTTGESPTLSHDEHSGWSTGASAGQGRVPVRRRPPARLDQGAIDLAKHADKAGAERPDCDALLQKADAGRLYQHFKAINDAIGIPIIIYNIPGRSVVDMSDETMKRLFELRTSRASRTRPPTWCASRSSAG